MQREISNNHVDDWEEQHERLSAYLDNELGEGERAALERHLTACDRCQQALGELREVRSLLRALPTPALPRSFAIPTRGEVPVPLTSVRGERARAGGQRQGTRGSGVWSGLAQTVGGFVATAGVMLVVGSALVSVSHRNFSTASTVARPYQSSTSPRAGQSKDIATPPRASEGASTAATTAQATSGGTTTTTTPTPTESPEEPVELPVGPIGAGLAVGGAVVFVAGRVAASRRGRG